MGTRPREAAFKDTSDLAFAGYCHMRGLKIVKVEQWRARNNALEYKFIFRDPSTEEKPHGLWEQLLLDFANSEARKFDSSIRVLKQLGKRKSGSR
jgi:hypothetical protein